MTPVFHIYFEGGGDTNRTRDLLLPGMNELLSPIKEAVRAKRWRWRLVACGGRREAYDRFMLARRNAEAGDIIILLVDAEGDIAPVEWRADGTPVTRKLQHLRTRRGDGWDMTDVDENHVHVMAQAMEAWIAADPNALAAYYGQGFRAGALPVRPNLEEEPKENCAEALASATRGTRKGEYHKIQHAKDLLARVDRDEIMARRPHARVLFNIVANLAN